jgi:hypothetical protein
LSGFARGSSPDSSLVRMVSWTASLTVRQVQHNAAPPVNGLTLVDLAAMESLDRDD